MRILMLVLNVAQRATYWRAYQLAKHLAPYGHQVTLIATSRDRRTGMMAKTEGNLTLVETPDMFKGALRSGWDPWNVANRISWLSGQTPFDLIHAFECRPTVIYPARSAARRSNAPLIIDWADWFGKGGSVEERSNPIIRAVLRPVETYFEERFRPLADGNTVICSTLKHKAIALGVPESSVLWLPNGSDTERFTPIRIQEARQQVGYSPQAFIIGYVGTIFGRDARLLADAFDLVHEKLPQSRLLIAGHCPLDIARMVRDPQSVIQTGYLSEDKLNLTLSTSDIFWLPLSDSNANRGRFPLKLTDYLAIGRPVVATAVGDVPLVFGDEDIGRLSAPAPDSIADQTLQLHLNPDLQAVMSRNARHLAETRFAWKNIAANLEDFYQMVIKTSEKGR